MNLRLICSAFLLSALLPICRAEESVATEPNAAPAAAPAPEDLTYEKSVVMLEIVQQEWDYKTPWKQAEMGRGVGTGFIIDGKRILTNAHNVGNVRYLEVKKQNIAQRYPARVVFVGHDCDLAIVAVEDPNFYTDLVPLEFGGIPKANTKVTTCGFPLGGRQVSITEGVVSRIEVGSYSHTQADMHLLVQTDAAINPGNSGGPVLQDGKVVGVAFQGLQSADNIGFMIPTTVIDHFLKDIADGTYDGFPSAGIGVFEGLHNPAYRAYCKLPDFVQGVVITFVQRNTQSASILQPGDVLTQVDGFNIDNDGMIKIYGLNLDWSEALEQKQIGQTYEISFAREGKPQKATLTAALDLPILPWGLQFDIKPEYYVYAGLTFTPLSRNYLQTFGQKWLTEIPFTLRYLFHNSQQLNADPNLKQYVVLSEILPDEVNTWCSPFKSQVVTKVNGQPVYAIADIKEALKAPKDGCHIFEFLGSDMNLILDAKEADKKHPVILEKYEVPADSYFKE